MLRNVSCGAAVFTTQRQALEQATDDEDGGGRIADRLVTGQQADHEGREAHESHGDEERVFAANHVAQAPEEQRAEGTNRETGRKAEEHEDELGGVVGSGHEVLADVQRKRACQVEIVPFEDGAGRGGYDNLPLLLGHGTGLFGRSRRCGCCCHSVSFQYSVMPVSRVLAADGPAAGPKSSRPLATTENP